MVHLNQLPKILPDRDKTRKWYLDEKVTHQLHNGDVLVISAGYRFDAHSVPWYVRWLFPQFDTDIYAALIHDALRDLEPWHRYDRKFIDTEYDIVMQQVSYGKRKYWMPKAVYVWGYIKTFGWRDYRGDYGKRKTTLRVEMVQ